LHAFTMPLPLVAPPVPQLIAAQPAQAPRAFVPFSQPSVSIEDQIDASMAPESFDAIARASRVASLMPRDWRGTYQSFQSAPILPVQLAIDTAEPIGQMIDLRGRLRIGEVEMPVQGNLNAKSDQLDLLVLGESGLKVGLEPGGEFQGVQGLSLSGWYGPRMTAIGGRLQLIPSASFKPAATSGVPDKASDRTVRGLW
jgi:hypothetical protein